jgi:hypothetical protein
MLTAAEKVGLVFILFGLQVFAGYFDPHNHLNGILPWKAYTNLPEYTEDRDTTVDFDAKLSLWSNVSAKVQTTEDPLPLYNAKSKLDLQFQFLRLTQKKNRH